MWETYYLLDMGNLMEKKTSGKQGIIQKLEALLDEERLLKYRKIKSEKAALQSLGAGLLLQVALREYLLERSVLGKQRLTPEAILEYLQKEAEEGREKSGGRIQIQYRHGAEGKPYFANFPLFFSLSHSGDFVFCAVSEREIGADLQEETDADWETLSRRFFSVRERERLSKELFFRIWCRKEAYAKLTGEGLAASLGTPVPEEEQGIFWKEGAFDKHGKTYRYCTCTGMPPVKRETEDATEYGESRN